MLEDCDCEYSQVDEIAESIYESEFYDFFDSDVTEDVPKIKTFKARISAWIETNIGQLNILIHSNHRITKKNDICPRLRPEEISILIQLYLREFYKRESRLALKGVSSSSSSTTTGESSVTMTDWVELREGDSSIKRQSLITTPQQKIQAAQTYKSISKEADLRIKDMVQYYNLYNSLPRQVVSQGLKTTSCDKKSKDCKEELVDCPEKVATLTPTPPCNEPTSTLTATETQTSTVTPTVTKTTTTTFTLTHTSTLTPTSTSTTTETSTSFCCGDNSIHFNVNGLSSSEFSSSGSVITLSAKNSLFNNSSNNVKDFCFNGIDDSQYKLPFTIIFKDKDDVILFAFTSIGALISNNFKLAGKTTELCESCTVDEDNFCKFDFEKSLLL